MKKVKIIVYGHVQGIGFRYSALKTAYRMGIRGFVENRDDGTVYIEAEGEDAPLGEFVEWCREGPVTARVERIETEETEPEDFSRFEIR